MTGGPYELMRTFQVFKKKGGGPRLTVEDFLVGRQRMNMIIPEDQPVKILQRTLSHI